MNKTRPNRVYCRVTNEELEEIKSNAIVLLKIKYNTEVINFEELNFEKIN